MIDSKQLVFDIIQDVDGLEITDVYSDNNMSVRVLIRSSKNQDQLDVPASEIKCYHPGKKTHLTILKTAAPLIWLIPTNPVRDNESYDLGVIPALHNGSCFGDEDGHVVCPSEFRRARPELEAFFNLPVVKEIANNIPCLGVRFTNAEFAQARTQAWGNFSRRTESVFNHYYQAFKFAGLCFFKLPRLIDLTPVIPHYETHRGKLLWFLQQDLLDGTGILLKDIESMSDHDFDIQGARYEFIAMAVKNWLAPRRCMNMIRKVAPAQADVALSLIQSMITEELNNKLDESILETHL